MVCDDVVCLSFPHKDLLDAAVVVAQANDVVLVQQLTILDLYKDERLVTDAADRVSPTVSKGHGKFRQTSVRTAGIPPCRLRRGGNVNNPRRTPDIAVGSRKLKSLT